MPTFIKAGLWTKKKEGFKGELNLDQFVASKTSAASYKVFTALLSQSGGDVPVAINAGTGTIVIGATYQITGDSPNCDFTNIGAPNNNGGTFFIATGTVPNSWGDAGFDEIVITGNLGAPVATVLENTIGNIWFTYNAVGFYYCYSDGLFNELKTTLSIGNIRDDDGYASVANIGLDGITINYFNIITSPFQNNTDGKLSNTPIEIRVYN